MFIDLEFKKNSKTSNKCLTMTLTYNIIVHEKKRKEDVFISPDCNSNRLKAKLYYKNTKKI